MLSTFVKLAYSSLVRQFCSQWNYHRTPRREVILYKPVLARIDVRNPIVNLKFYTRLWQTMDRNAEAASYLLIALLYGVPLHARRND